MRLLIVKLGAIGDIVHTLPALAAIRRERADVHITWAAERRSAEILRDNPMIDELLELDTRAMREGSLMDEMMPEIRRQIAPLRNTEFDLAIDFQGLLKSALVAKLSGAASRWGFSRKSLREPASRFLLTHTVKIPSGIHVIKKNLMLAEAALGPFAKKGPIEFPISTSEEDKIEAQAMIERAGGRFVILNPGGGWVTKLWDADKFGRLADVLWERHGLVPIIAIGPFEGDIAERALASSRTGRAFWVAPSLKGFYELVRHAALYIGGDTGPTHLAVAAGAPVVGIFGPTEWWRNGSIDPADVCLERTDIGCRTDCHRRTCSNWICMDIDVETAASAVNERLAAVAQRPAQVRV